jgi:alkylhydroperoxidase family enzyme
MALIPYPDPGTIDEATHAAIDHFASEHGRPTLLRIMLSYSSPAQQAMDALYHPVAESGVLPRPLKELLFAAASHARQCAYCMGGHSLFLVSEFGYDQWAVEAMRSGQEAAGFSEADRGLVTLVRKAAAEPSAVTAEDLDAARHLGCTRSGSTGRFDLVVCCGGIYSATRELLFDPQPGVDTGWIGWT